VDPTSAWPHSYGCEFDEGQIVGREFVLMTVSAMQAPCCCTRATEVQRWPKTFLEFDKEVSMITKAILLSFAFAVSLTTASPVFSQQAPPFSERAKQVEALVNKAAALIDKNGKAAFAEFRKKDSEWFHGDTYLFVYDMKENVLLNPAIPQREGTNVAGQKDAKG